MKQYRCRTDERSDRWWDDPEQDGLWDDDLSIVEEEAEIHRELGARNVRIEVRDVG